MKECALFLLSHMVYNNGGRITIGKCTDIERLGPAVENAFLTSCGAIYSFETAAKAADILGIDAETAKLLGKQPPDCAKRFRKTTKCIYRSKAAKKKAL